MTTPQDPSAAGSSQPPQWDSPPTWGPPGQGGEAYGGVPGYGPPPGYGPAPQAYGAPPAYGGGYGGRYGGGQQTSTKAIIVLCLAIGSFVVFPLLPAIVALVMAPGARDEIEASGGRLSGEGLLTAGKVVAWINVGFCVLGVLAVVAVFGLFATTGFS